MCTTGDADVARRPTAGRPPDQRVGPAVLAATLALVGELGVAGVTTDGVAARAGVSKASIYRRWPSKQELLRDAAASLVADIQIPDTGSLAGDVRALLGSAIALYAGELPGRIIPALISEMAFDPGVAEAIRTGFLARRRDDVLTVIDRARMRKELRADLDDELVLDLLAGVVYYRFLVTGGPLDDALADRLTRALLHGIATTGDTDGATA